MIKKDMASRSEAKKSIGALPQARSGCDMDTSFQANVHQMHLSGKRSAFWRDKDDGIYLGDVAIGMGMEAVLSGNVCA